jgi:hypothetical protein
MSDRDYARREVTAVESYCGHYLDYLDPRPEHIELEDIARGLSQICRFAGQTNRFYSVAEHAVYVRSLVIEAGYPELGLAALHHDSHEAYLGDWPSPLKYALDDARLREMAYNIDAAICLRLGYGLCPSAFHHPLVKEMDTLAIRREAATLKYSHGVGEHWGYETPLLSLAGIGWDHDKAEREFLKAHREETAS